jgi:prepilin-type N-terminal cleavage/methylation domain-containing protein/prepilin-type processing-associated H-X9-DG protein
MPATPSQCRGFTLLELLVVLAIFAVLMGLLLAAVQQVRATAARLQCQNNLHQLALAAHSYHGAHERFPVGLAPANHFAGRYSGTTNLWIELLPYFEQDNLGRRWSSSDYRNNLVGGTNATTAVVVKILLCPSDALPSPPVAYLHWPPPYDWCAGYYGLSSYGGNGGTLAFNWDDPTSNDGIFFLASHVRLADITDGSSQTFLFGERSHWDPEFDRLTSDLDPLFGPLAAWGRWAAAFGPYVPHGDLFLGTPDRINYRVPPGSNDSDWTWETNRLNVYGSGHPCGANFAFADGSVRFVSDGIALGALQALSTRAGGEVVEAP